MQTRKLGLIFNKTVYLNFTVVLFIAHRFFRGRGGAGFKAISNSFSPNNSKVSSL